MERGGIAPHLGDSALAALLSLHGMAMNGGLDHAVDVLSAEQFHAAIDGFRYFGLIEMAVMLSHAISANDEELERLDTEYGKLVPTDSTLGNAFEETFRVSPDAFSPLKP